MQGLIDLTYAPHMIQIMDDLSPQSPVKVVYLCSGTQLSKSTLNLILIGPLKLAGLALATTLSSATAFIMLGAMLKRRLGDIRGWEIGRAALKIAVASGIMGIVIYLISTRLEPTATDIWGKSLQVGVSLGAGVGIFIIVSFVLRVKGHLPLAIQ